METYNETPLELLSVDMKQIGKHLYLMYEREEIVRQKVMSCIPRRQVDIDGTARRPITIAYLDTDTYNRTIDSVTEKGIPKWNWEKEKIPSVAQRRIMKIVS